MAILTDVKLYSGDGIYVIERRGNVQVRRVQKIDEGYILIPDNRVYQRETVPEVKVLARVAGKVSCITL